MKELRRMVIEEMTEKVRIILSSSERDGLRWNGTKGDLVELLHEVYYHCGITTADGNYATFSYLVDKVFRVFGITPPRNPRSRALRAEGRKGVRSASLMSRMEEAMSSSDGTAALDRLWGRLVA